jgi:hypothetical protein
VTRPDPDQIGRRLRRSDLLFFLAAAVVIAGISMRDATVIVAGVAAAVFAVAFPRMKGRFGFNPLGSDAPVLEAELTDPREYDDLSAVDEADEEGAA